MLLLLGALPAEFAYSINKIQRILSNLRPLLQFSPHMLSCTMVRQSIANCAHELQGYLFSQPVCAKEAYRMQEHSDQRNFSADIVSISDLVEIQRTG